MSRPAHSEVDLGDVLITPSSSLATGSVTRIKSQDLFRQMREVEIDHDGRIYKLRLTQLNKLILTA
jgi:hemin uptake protein HemP